MVVNEDIFHKLPVNCQVAAGSNQVATGSNQVATGSSESRFTQHAATKLFDLFSVGGTTSNEINPSKGSMELDTRSHRMG